MRYMCLRDDDTNYYTSVQELKEGYDWVWGKLPVTLATIPFVHGAERKILDFDTDPNKFGRLRDWEIQATKEELADFNLLHPVGNNKELIDELCNMLQCNKVEIAQHGVTHKYNERGAEMFSDAVSLYDLRAGKEYLEKCFQIKINIFIPPSNTIDFGCADNVNKLGMRIFSSGTPKASNTMEKIKACVKDPSPVIERVCGADKPIKSRNGIRVVGSYTYGLFDSEDKMFETLKEKLDRYGFAAMGTHYRLLANDEYKLHYLNVIKRILDLGDVEFVTASEYFRLVEKKFYE